MKRPRVHGRTATYVHGGCRCEACRDAWSRYTRQRRADAKRKLEAKEVGGGVIMCGMCGRPLKGHDLGGVCYRIGRGRL